VIEEPGDGSGDALPPGPPHHRTQPGSSGRVSRYGPLVLGGIALGMHLTVGAAYALTLLLAPPWVSVVVAVWWLALLLLALLLLARRSAAVLAVPLVAIASWAALISAGRAWFGWS
jgi:hypothetical protein